MDFSQGYFSFVAFTILLLWLNLIAFLQVVSEKFATFVLALLKICKGK